MKVHCVKGILIQGFLGLLVALGFQFSAEAQDGTIKTVVIDAGHGGHDAGNLGTGRYKKTEKDVSLEVALKVGEYIKEAYPQVKVIYTRKDDRFIQLQERASIANRNHADLFISIHCNAAKATQASGTETWVMGLHRSKENLEVAMRENSVILMEDNYKSTYEDFNPRDPDSYINMVLLQSAYLDQSINLASSVQEDFNKKLGRRSRGIKQAGFLVLYKSAMPSILIELGFLTNSEEEDFLQSSDGKIYMASSIFRAFKVYKESREGVSTPMPGFAKSEPDPGNAQKETPKEIVPKEVRDNKPKKEDKKESVKITNQNPDKQDVAELLTPVATDVAVAPEILFKVQFITSPQKIAKGSSRFKHLDEIEQTKVKAGYKYTSGSFAVYKDAKVRLEEVKEKFPSAFVVAFKNGEPIAVQEAIKLLETNKK